MCEPLSIISSTLAIASTAITLGQQTYEIVTGIQDAPDHIRRLATDLKGFYHVLGLLTQALTTQSQPSKPESLPTMMISNVQELLQKTIEIFKDISRIVQPYLDSNGNALRSFTKSFRWEMTRKANVVTMQRTLSDYKLTLELAISSLNFINSSQTIDMVAHLQKDFRKLRRQIDNRDRDERAQRYQTAQEPTQGTENVNQDTYSEPMRRFLARTASVISTTSTSTHVADSIFSDDLFDIASVTEYTEVPATEAVALKSKDIESADVSSEPSPKIPEIRHTDLEGSERSLNDILGSDPFSNSSANGSILEKSSTWKRFRNRIKRNSSSPSLGSLPEFDSASPITPASNHTLTPQRSFQRLGRDDDTEPAERKMSSASSKTSMHKMVSRKPAPMGAELTKSSSVPMFSHQDQHTKLRPPEQSAHRASTTPISTLSSFQEISYGLSRFNSPDNDPEIETPATTAQNDRDALLSSLRRGASKSISATNESQTSSSSATLASLCNSCTHPIEQQKHYAIRKNKWHVHCFRCNSCQVLLQSDSSTVFLVKDDFLVCNSCAYNCQSCDRRIEDHGANDESLTGSYGRIQSMTQAPGQLTCPGLFFCHDCHKSIKNMRYARTLQGIFCLACHPQTMSQWERERRERERDEMSAVPVLIE